MGSDPQSYLSAMHEIEHRECRRREEELTDELARIRDEIGDLFGEVGGVKASTPQQAWLKLEAAQNLAEAVRESLEAAEVLKEKAVRDRDFTIAWYATRWQSMSDFFRSPVTKDTTAAHTWFSIIANGEPCLCGKCFEERKARNPEAGERKPLSYAALLNIEKFRKQAAEKKLAEAVAENKRLRKAVLNQCADNLCWFSDPNVGKAVPEAEFLESCRRYRDQISTGRGDLDVGQMTIAQLEAEVTRLRTGITLANERLKETMKIMEGEH